MNFTNVALLYAGRTRPLVFQVQRTVTLIFGCNKSLGFCGRFGTYFETRRILFLVGCSDVFRSMSVNAICCGVVKEGVGRVCLVEPSCAGDECTFLPFPVPCDPGRGGKRGRGRSVSPTHLYCFLLQHPATGRTKSSPGEEPFFVDTSLLSPQHDICSG